MTSSDCSYVAVSRAQHRKKMFIICILCLLPSLFLIFQGEPQKSTSCRRPGCLQSISANSSKPANGRAAALVSATAEPPSGTPPNWTFASPDTWDELVPLLFDYIEKPHARCEKAVRVGGQPDYKSRKFDGYKWVCLDPELGLLQTNSCLIYSFGISTDWSFDDNVQRLQCEIHAFDPSIGKKDHKRSPLISFHNVGIGGQNEIRKIPLGLFSRRLWDVRTYESIVRHLGHENRTVHYLKIDVEGSEWAMLAQMVTHTPQLLQNVRQIAVEVHMQSGQKGRARLSLWKGYLGIFLRLERMGFRLFHSEINPYTVEARIFAAMNIDRKVARVYEMVWIRQPW